MPFQLVLTNLLKANCFRVHRNLCKRPVVSIDFLVFLVQTTKNKYVEKRKFNVQNTSKKLNVHLVIQQSNVHCLLIRSPSTTALRRSQFPLAPPCVGCSGDSGTCS